MEITCVLQGCEVSLGGRVLVGPLLEATVLLRIAFERNFFIKSFFIKMISEVRSQHLTGFLRRWHGC